MQLYLSASPDQVREAAGFCRNLAHAAYRIGPESALLRKSVLLQTRGGLLSLSDAQAPMVEDPASLCAQIQRECSRRGYNGVVLDFEAAPRADLLALAGQLSRTLASAKRALYVTEGYARAAQSASALICTALSGGSFTQYLQEAAGRMGGPGRIALDVQRLRMDFRLPARTGQGDLLTQAQLQALLKQESPSVFFSRDLCARYFTYLREGEAHFVLFDDADTLRQKLRAGTALGIPAAFFVWPEIRDIAAALFSRQG